MVNCKTVLFFREGKISSSILAEGATVSPLLDDSQELSNGTCMSDDSGEDNRAGDSSWTEGRVSEGVSLRLASGQYDASITDHLPLLNR